MEMACLNTFDCWIFVPEPVGDYPRLSPKSINYSSMEPLQYQLNYPIREKKEFVGYK